MATLEAKTAEQVVEACVRTESVRKCVFTSSLLACVWRQSYPHRHRFPATVDESCWSDETFCREKKVMRDAAEPVDSPLRGSTGNVSNGVTQFFLVAVVCAWQDDGGEGGVEGGTGPGPEARDGVPGAGDRAGFPPAQLHPLHCLPQRSLSLCLLSVFASNQHCPRSTDKLLFL